VRSRSGDGDRRFGAFETFRGRRGLALQPAVGFGQLPDLPQERLLLFGKLEAERPARRYEPGHEAGRFDLVLGGRPGEGVPYDQERKTCVNERGEGDEPRHALPDEKAGERERQRHGQKRAEDEGEDPRPQILPYCSSCIARFDMCGLRGILFARGL
jgi:hypothetical protein